MPFNLPLKKSSSSTPRRPSSPTPRPAITTNGSTCSDSTSASETSSLEAAPMRPPMASLTLRETEGTENGGGYGYGRIHFQSTSAANKGSGSRSPLQINTSPPTPQMMEKQRQDSTTSTLLPPNRDALHSPTHNGSFSAPTSRESSVTRSPVTPRAARSGAYHTFSQPPALLVDPDARQLLGAARGSSSGPDLASLRRRAKEERRSGGGTDGEGLALREEKDPSLVRTSPVFNNESNYNNADSGKDVPPREEGRAASTTRVEPRRAVGLQDFVFGEVIGRGSYSTVRGLGYLAREDGMSLLIFPLTLTRNRSLDSLSTLCRFCASCAPAFFHAYSLASYTSTPLPSVSPTDNPLFSHSLAPLPSLGYLSLPRFSRSLTGHPRNPKSNSPPLRHQNTRPVPTRTREKDKVRQD